MDLNQAHGNFLLPDKRGFHDLFTVVDMVAAGDRMNEDAISLGGGKFLDSFDQPELRILGGADEAAHMDMKVALGADLDAVIGESPIVAELFSCSLHGELPQTDAFVAGHLVERMFRFIVAARQHEPAHWLAGIDVLQEKELHIRRLFFRLIAEAAFPGFQRFGVFRITGAARDIGAQGARSEQTGPEQKGPSWKWHGLGLIILVGVLRRPATGRPLADCCAACSAGRSVFLGFRRDRLAGTRRTAVREHRAGDAAFRRLGHSAALGRTLV